ncbi:Cof subfamily protein (haloacid dehalogenase superfamily) [Microbacterium resistens]|uniref:Cof subfamily protein (Haloacid dehalogenase superfamily) n=1 Tax=Microbacterium resistens TaxID=156977 RepID=A0ABU1SBW1_9MICO|nr:Cof-type HAD-IIB family hydrolase [Microbacterium resistens]MDR6867051.1 Cof subfamily protein (haloacid dehalogenase superfamily) [Microbacterium resistens]
MPATPALPRLIATDLDHTLLSADGVVTPRTRAALDAARTAGILVVPVTARQPIGLREVAAGAAFEGWALCGNGAFGIHLTTGDLLFAQEIPAVVQREIADALTVALPGVLFASVRHAGERFVAQEGYAALARLSDHKRDPRTMGGAPLAEVVAEPSLKLVIRHPDATLDEIFGTLQGLGLAGFEATLSGAPFVEVMAEGVTKASGLAQLCAHLGIGREEVVAFGDGLNDLEMLRWAGRGVAVANAIDVLRDAADEIAPPNDEDGVAVTIERLLV